LSLGDAGGIQIAFHLFDGPNQPQPLTAKLSPAHIFTLFSRDGLRRPEGLTSALNVGDPATQHQESS
jgi:hypothetical protein